jgi:hypothetical protein
MATLHDHGSRAIVVMDGRRAIAVARNKGYGRGWLLSARGFCWTDPRARARNAFGIVSPELLLVRTKREALGILTEVAGGTP